MTQHPGDTLGTHSRKKGWLSTVGTPGANVRRGDTGAAQHHGDIPGQHRYVQGGLWEFWVWGAHGGLVLQSREGTR